MLKKEIYIGLYNDDRESLFYRKDKNVYYDLKADRIVKYDEIQKNSLIPYKNVIRSNSNLKKNIIRLYNMDRMQEMSLNKVFIGNVYELNNVVISEVFSHDVENLKLNVETNTASNIELVKKDVLLFSVSEYPVVSVQYDDLMDLETGYIYDADFKLENGNRYVPRTVDEVKSFPTVLDLKEKTMEKGKILEKYREYKRR